MKKRQKLILIISCLLVLGFLLTSFTSFFVSRKTLRSEVETNTLPLTGDTIYSEIQRDLLRPVFISSLMASDTFLRDWILTGEENTHNITKFLKEIKREYNTFTAFLVSEKSRHYYHADGVLKNVSESEPRDAWYFRVREMNSDFEINVDPDMANEDTMTIFVNYRVYDYAGRYIGATGVGLNVSAVKSLIEEYQKKYDRSIFFVAEDGTVKLAGSRFPKGIDNIHQRQNFPSISPKSVSGKENYRYTEDSRLVHANIRYIPEFNWFLVVEQFDFKSTKRLITTLCINIGICLLITAIVVVLVNLSITAYHNRIEVLRGIVPICSYCKQIRDDKGYWNQVEAYVAQHTDAEFSHSICPSCLAKEFPEYRE